MSWRDIVNQMIPSYEELHPGRDFDEDDDSEGALMPVFCEFCMADITESGLASYCPSCGRNISGNARPEDYGKRKQGSTRHYPNYDPNDDEI
jgi:hypothetical protein